MSMWKKSIWKRKKTYRKFDFGIRNYAVRSMRKKSIWKRKDHIEKKEAIF